MWLPAGVGQGRCCFNIVTALTKVDRPDNHGLAILDRIMAEILLFVDLEICKYSSQYLDIYC